MPKPGLKRKTSDISVLSWFITNSITFTKTHSFKIKWQIRDMIEIFIVNQPLNVPGVVDAASFVATKEIIYAVVLGFW
jgi:hypothetical protein